MRKERVVKTVTEILKHYETSNLVSDSAKMTIAVTIAEKIEKELKSNK